MSQKIVDHLGYGPEDRVGRPFSMSIHAKILSAWGGHTESHGNNHGPSRISEYTRPSTGWVRADTCGERSTHLRQ
jgi:hypothetical protein